MLVFTEANDGCRYTKEGKPFAEYDQYVTSKGQVLEIGKSYRLSTKYAHQDAGEFIVTNIYKDPIGFSQAEGLVTVAGFKYTYRTDEHPELLKKDAYSPYGWKHAKFPQDVSLCEVEPQAI